MFSTATVTPGPGRELGQVLLDPPAVPDLPAVGWVDHHERRADLFGQVDRPVDLAHGVRCPTPARDQQERGVDGPRRQAELRRGLAQQVGLLGGGVLGDHDLDRVEPGLGDAPERLPERLAEERRRGEQQRGRVAARGPLSWLAGQSIDSRGRSNPTGAPGYPSAAVSEADNLPSPGRPGYEVWFLTFTDPGIGPGLLDPLSYHVPERGPRGRRVWFARFDPADPDRTFGVHRTGPTSGRVSSTGSTSGSAGGSIASGPRRGDARGRRPPDRPGTSRSRSARRPTDFSPTPCTAAGSRRPGPTRRTRDTRSRDRSWWTASPSPWPRPRASRATWSARATPSDGRGPIARDFLDEDAVVHALTAQSRRGPIS